MTREEFSDEYRGNVSALLNLAYEDNCYDITDKLLCDDSIAEMIANDVSGRDYYSWHDIVSRYVDICESPYDTYYYDDYGEITAITDDDADWMYDIMYDLYENEGYFDEDDEEEQVDEDEDGQPDKKDSEFILSSDNEEELLRMKRVVRPLESLLTI